MAIIKTVFQFRRGTTDEWLRNKDVKPAPGEPCFDLEAHTLRIGDGETTYENLPVIGGVKVELAADNKSLVLEDGIFKLLGFEAAEVGAQLVKGENGIEWIVPSTETVEGLQTAVATLQTNVTNLQNNVTNIQNILTPAEGDTLLSRIEGLEFKMDETGDGTVDDKINKKINEFATQISDDEIVNSYKELIDYVAEHGGEAATMAANIKTLQDLVGGTPVNDQILAAIQASGHIDEKKANAIFEHVKYEISSKPVGTLVNYGDKEIRVMVPADTEFVHQNSGATAAKNQYYIGFKAYAPEGAVSFKEDLAEIISDDTMYYFEGNDFAGVDAYGRKYSICWLSVAYYDEATQTWTRYADQSSKERCIGYYYSVEWYDANGVKIDSDCIRISLSNEDCHNTAEPYYMSKVVKGVSVGDTVLDIVNNNVVIPVGAGLKGSDEIEIAEDGAINVKTISWDKISQGESELVLDGGSADVRV